MTVILEVTSPILELDESNAVKVRIRSLPILRNVKVKLHVPFISLRSAIVKRPPRLIFTTNLETSGSDVPENVTKVLTGNTYPEIGCLIFKNILIDFFKLS